MQQPTEKPLKHAWLITVRIVTQAASNYRGLDVCVYSMVRFIPIQWGLEVFPIVIDPTYLLTTSGYIHIDLINNFHMCWTPRFSDNGHTCTSSGYQAIFLLPQDLRMKLQYLCNATLSLNKPLPIGLTLLESHRNRN